MKLGRKSKEEKEMEKLDKIADDISDEDIKTMLEPELTNLTDSAPITESRAVGEAIRIINDPASAENGMLTELERERGIAMSVEESLARTFCIGYSLNLLGSLKRHFKSNDRKSVKELIEVIQAMKEQKKKGLLQKLGLKGDK